MRKRRILLAGVLARMEDTRLSKCVMFGELIGGAGCVGARKKNDGEWRKTAEQEAEMFMAEWMAAEKLRAELRHVVVCPNVTLKASVFVLILSHS